jgi:hypothetical protein
LTMRRTALHCTELHGTSEHGNAVHCSAVHYTALHRAELCRTVLMKCTALLAYTPTPSQNIAQFFGAVSAWWGAREPMTYGLLSIVLKSVLGPSQKRDDEDDDSRGDTHLHRHDRLRVRS